MAKLHVEAIVEGQRIVIQHRYEGLDTSSTLIDTIARRVIDLEEQVVVAALISLGWTPPKENKNA